MSRDARQRLAVSGRAVAARDRKVGHVAEGVGDRLHASREIAATAHARLAPASRCCRAQDDADVVERHHPSLRSTSRNVTSASNSFATRANVRPHQRIGLIAFTTAMPPSLPSPKHVDRLFKMQAAMRAYRPTTCAPRPCSSRCRRRRAIARRGVRSSAPPRGAPCAVRWPRPPARPAARCAPRQAPARRARRFQNARSAARAVGGIRAHRPLALRPVRSWIVLHDWRRLAGDAGQPSRRLAVVTARTKTVVDVVGKNSKSVR